MPDIRTDGMVNVVETFHFFLKLMLLKGQPAFHTF